MQTVTKAPKATRVARLANQFRAIHAQCKTLRDRKSEISDGLKKDHVEEHNFADGVRLVFLRDKERILSLSALEGILGEAAAKRVWEKLPERDSGYYTIVQPKKPIQKTGK